MENKLVSIIVSVYNGERYIEECIESVLNQDYKNIELILVDDGSFDSSNVIQVSQVALCRLFHSA
jgi:glycosyltransferase involved in cell wall biosynthesis